MDNLFVKKSMAEQKAMARPVPATPPRPIQQQQATSPGLDTSPGGCGQLPRPAAAASSTSTTPVRGGQAMGGARSKPSSASNLAGLDDPFAELGGISKPPPMAAQRWVEGSHSAGTAAHSRACKAAPGNTPCIYKAAQAVLLCVLPGTCRSQIRSPTPPRAPEVVQQPALQQQQPLAQQPVTLQQQQQPVVSAAPAGEHHKQSSLPRSACQRLA